MRDGNNREDNIQSGLEDINKNTCVKRKRRGWRQKRLETSTYATGIKYYKGRSQVRKEEKEHGQVTLNTRKMGHTQEGDVGKYSKEEIDNRKEQKRKAQNRK